MIHSRWLEHTVRIASCSIDPVSLTTLALAGLAGGGAAAATSALTSSSAPAPVNPAAPPTPKTAAPAANAPSGIKPKAQSNSPSFIGSAAAPSQVGYGSKTLLGQ